MADEAARRGRRVGAGLGAAATRLGGSAASGIRQAAARVDEVPSGAADLALAGLALVVMAGERIVSRSSLGAPLPVALALTTVIAGCLALRRRAPLTAYAVGTAALAAEALWVSPSPFSPYANLVGLYSLGLYATRARALCGPAIILPGVLAYFAHADGPGLVPAGVVFTWLLVWGAGYSGARRRERQEAARRRMRREAVADERNRIARELHDLIGHTLTVMLVRVGAARVVLDGSPDQAREILLGVEQTSRESLDELDQVLGILRRDDVDDDLREGTDLRPGLTDLPRLARRMTEAGMDVAVRVEPPDLRLPRSLDVSVYRIVQEALTNALRHGRAGTATVHVAGDGTRVRLDIRDYGQGPPPGYRPGRGLLGIAERAAIFAGTVEHGPVEHGTARHGPVEHGAVEHGGVERGGVEHGTARLGAVEHGTVEHGTARLVPEGGGGFLVRAQLPLPVSGSGESRPGGEMTGRAAP